MVLAQTGLVRQSIRFSGALQWPPNTF